MDRWENSLLCCVDDNSIYNEVRFTRHLDDSFMSRGGMNDLHCHSIYSDGLHDPKDLVQLAVNANVGFFALTDHDTLDGLDDLHQAAQGKSLTIINGIELSARWKKYDVHILGLKIDPSQNILHQLIEQQKQSRIERAKKIGVMLKNVGVVNAYEKACVLAGHERVGRPHFAAVLVHENKVKDIQSAFKQYLGQGKIAYVSSAWITLETAVDGIMRAGGQAVMAHPLKYKLTRTKLHELIKDFKMNRGVGIEVVSGAMNAKDIQTMAVLSQRFDLLASSGSDYHGAGLSIIGIGRQMKLPEQCQPIWHTWNGV